MIQLPRRYAAALSAALLLALAPRARAQTLVVGPGASGVSAIPNGFFTVPVVADMTGAGGASLGSITARLLWRPGTVRFVSASAGTAGTPALNPDTTAGELRFAVANAGGLTGTPVLVNAVFQAIGAAGDTMTLRTIVDDATRAGSFTDLLPITAATGAQFCISPGRWGDLDGNDAVTSFDALLIVTDAVGLPIAPFTTANADVDNSGGVNTRDALGVLSDVVGLPTPGFRIGFLNPGPCSIRTAKTVALAPAGLTLAPGDQIALVATQRDSVGAVVGGAPASWLSRDTLVARVNALGKVTAIGAGTTRIVAVVAPGVMDSVGVAVGGARHSWYVDPVIAAGNQVELGSTAYPFSSIQAAVIAAASGDTVHVGVASYGEAVYLAKPLVLIGDSTAAGLPRLRTSTGVAIRVDTVPANISRIQIEDAPGGIFLYRVPSATLSGIVIVRSRAYGIGVHGSGVVMLDHVAIDGAVDVGIGIDSTRVLRVTNSRIDLIAATGGNRGRAIAAQHVDTLDASASLFSTAGIDAIVDSAVILTHVTVDGSAGSGIAISGAPSVVIVGGSVGNASQWAPNLDKHIYENYAVQIRPAPAGRVRLDSLLIHDNAIYGLVVRGAHAVTMRGSNVTRSYGAVGLATAMIFDVDSASVAQSQFVENGYGSLMFADSVLPGNMVARVDSSHFDETDVWAMSIGSFTMRGGDVTDGYNPAINAVGTGSVALANIVVTGTQIGGPSASLSPAAVAVSYADSARADSLWIHDNEPGAMRFDTVGVVTSRGGVYEANWTNTSYYYVKATVQLLDVPSGRLSQSVFDDRGGTAGRSVDLYFSYIGSGRSVVVDSSTFLGSNYGVFAQGVGYYYYDTVTVRGSTFRPGNAGSVIGTGIYASYLNRLYSIDNTIDSTAYAVYGYGVGGVGVTNTVMRRVLYGGVFVFASGTNDTTFMTGSSVACDTAYSSGAAFTAYYAPIVANNNTISRCAVGINGYNSSYGPFAAVVRGNVLVSDSTYGSTGIQLYGRYTRPQIVGNDVGVGAFASNAIILLGYGYTIDSARVDSNLVHDYTGNGFMTSGPIGAISVRGNTFDHAGNFGANFAHSVGGARVVGNIFRNTVGTGVYVSATADTVWLDSNVVVDNTIGVNLAPGGENVLVRGTSDFFARNRMGLISTGFGTGNVLVANSVFQQDTVVGVSGGSGWDLGSNYWGDPLGPRCPSGCDSASVGDSVLGVGNHLPVLSSAPSTPTGVARPSLTLSRAVRAATTIAPFRGAAFAVRPARQTARAEASGAAEARRQTAEAQQAAARAAREGARP